MNSTATIKDKILVGGFVALLTLCFLAGLLLPDRDFSQNENRKLTQTPALSVKNLTGGQFMKDFETYTSDQFPLRDGWVGLRNTADIAMGKKDNGQVYFGKDNWLFAIDKINERQWTANLGFLKSYLTSVNENHPNTNISVLPAPSAAEIVKSPLPPFAPTVAERPLIAQLKEELDGLANVCDVTSYLSAAQIKDGDLYYRTDHHWTTLGAFYAYRLWARQMGLVPLDYDEFDITTVSDQFYGTNDSKANLFWTKPDQIQRFDPKIKDGSGSSVKVTIETGKPGKDSLRETSGFYDDSFLDVKDQYSYFLGGNHPVITIDTGLENGKTILVIKDSYAHSFVPFLASHYQRILLVDLRYYKNGLERFFEENDVTDLLVLYSLIQLCNDQNLFYLK